MEKIISLFLLFFSLNALAVELNPLSESKLEMVVPYSFGKHELKAKNFKGRVEWDEKQKKILKGEIRLSISEITGEKPTLICHLQESLGLDYKKSDFPDSHVCSDDKLPSEGKNAIVWPDISAELLSPLSVGDNTAKVKWTMHGQTRELEMPITIKEEGKSVILNSSWSMKRQDFGIVVKKFLFIEASDELPIKLHLSLGQ